MFFGRDSLVLYLENATAAVEDANQADTPSIRDEIEKFCDKSTDAFDEEIADGVHRIYGNNLNALVGYSNNADARTELCVVLEVYRIKNESEYLADLDTYKKDAESYDNSFVELDELEIDRWKEGIEYADDKMLVSN